MVSLVQIQLVDGTVTYEIFMIIDTICLTIFDFLLKEKHFFL